MPTTAERYEAKKRRAAEIQRTQSAAGRELAPLPAIRNPARRKAAADCLRTFAESYFGHVFFLEWAPDHLHVIEQLELAVREGRQTALAMPRGSGKTSLVTLAGIWAIVTGRRRYAVLIAAEKDKAETLLESIRTHLAHNDELAADFPEVCEPLRRLGRNNQRRFLWYGREVTISATKSQIRFADIPGSPAAGALVETAGITGSLRGLQVTTTAGEILRPDFALVDDPQTDQSAKSETQTADRLRTINGSVLGLPGPTETIACVACVTVIRKDDLADQILDRKANPQWRGIRLRLLEKIPESELWEEYHRIRERELQSDTGHDESTAFYTDNRDELDAGANPRWLQRYNPNEVSAVQHAMNLLQDRGRETFASEYQNEPQEQETADFELRADELRHRLSRIPRGIVPDNSTRLTAFVDVHENLLYWLTLATDDDFSAWVVDYGTYPKQRLTQFRLRNARNTIAKKHREIPTPEGRLYAALHATYDEILGRAWLRQDGTAVNVQRCLTDAQWGPMTETVYQAIRESRHRGLILPSHGRFVGAGQVPISRWKARKGESRGDEWRIGPNRNQLRVTFDANHWKTFSMARLLTPPGSAGAALFFGEDPEAHRLISQHLTAETATEVASKSRRIQEWRLKQSNPDNHWLDCFVGSCLAAGTLGARVLAETLPDPTTNQRRRESSDLF